MTVGKRYKYNGTQRSMNGRGGWVDEMSPLLEDKAFKLLRRSGSILQFEGINSSWSYKDFSLFDEVSEETFETGDIIYYSNTEGQFKPENKAIYLFNDKSGDHWHVPEETWKSEDFNGDKMSYHAYVTKTKPEADVKITVNGEEVTLSPETLASIRAVI